MEKSTHSKKYDLFRSLLIEARRKSHMTQVQVARLLSRHQSYVSKYEAGERRVDIVEFLEIARIINCDPLAVVAELDASEQG